MGPPQTVEGLNRIKRLTFPQGSQNSSGLKPFDLCALSFPDLQNGVKTLAPPGLQPASPPSRSWDLSGSIVM